MHQLRASLSGVTNALQCVRSQWTACSISGSIHRGTKLIAALSNTLRTAQIYVFSRWRGWFQPRTMQGRSTGADSWAAAQAQG
jgi:hypothetical protein